MNCHLTGQGSHNTVTAPLRWRMEGATDGAEARWEKKHALPVAEEANSETYRQPSKGWSWRPKWPRLQLFFLAHYATWPTRKALLTG